MSAAAILMLLRRPYCGPVYQRGPVYCQTPVKIKHIETGCLLEFDIIRKVYRGFYEKEGLRYSLQFSPDVLDMYDAKENFQILDQGTSQY